MTIKKEKSLGQFFTPDYISDFMVSLITKKKIVKF
jgi:type I restriction-modification system DNA methylase subunit